MENVRSKLIIGFGLVFLIICFFVVFWLLFYQKSIYYTKIDNEKVRVVDSGDMRYEYILDSYNENGRLKEVTFKTSRKLKKGAYLKLELMMTRGVKTWEEVPYKKLPSKVKKKYNR